MAIIASVQGTKLLSYWETTGQLLYFRDIVDRRPCDIVFVFADVGRAERELGWKAGRGIRDMVLDSWRFEDNNK